MIEKVGAALDRLIGAVSPKSQIKRQYYRALLKRSASYAAAQTDRLTGPWSPLNVNINELIRNSSPQVRARVRQLVRDFPYFKRAVQVRLDYTVGSGITFQSRILTPDGKLDKKRNTAVEDAFKFWADEADISGKLHFYEMMQLAARQDLESGEFIIARTAARRRNPYLPYALQIFESEWLADTPARSKRITTEFDQGIEYEKSTGAVVAYHFADPDGYGETMRVRASDIIHGFEMLRPGQLRGISPFTPAVLLAHDIGELIDSEVGAAKMASKYLAIVESENPFERQVNLNTDPDTGQKLDELENAVIEYLRPGEKISIATNPRPDSNLYPAVSLLARMISVSIGVPFELIAGDYTGFSYSTGRISRNDFSQQLRPIAVRHIRHFCQPAIRRFYDLAVAKGKIELPGYFRNPAPWSRAEWQPPGMEPVDPLKESKAGIDQIKSLSRSPQEIIRARGRDPEDVLKDISEFRALADEYDLKDFFDALFTEDPSTAIANNPEAVMNDQDQAKAARKVALVRGSK
jgi:lambda family phage portal protein